MEYWDLPFELLFESFMNLRIQNFTLAQETEELFPRILRTLLMEMTSFLTFVGDNTSFPKQIWKFSSEIEVKFILWYTSIFLIR